MGHKVTVNGGYTNVELPNGLAYNAGQTVILTDEQFSRIDATVFSDGVLSDGGAYPPVQGFPVQTAEQLANGTLTQANGNPGRYPFTRTEITNDSTALTVATVLVGAPVALYAGDVISNITVLTGATAPTTTHLYAALYPGTAGAAILQANLATTTAANTAYTAAFGAYATPTVAAPYNVLTTGIYYVVLVATGTTAPSILSHDYLAATLLAGTGATGQYKDAVLSAGASLTAPPATLSAVTGYAVGRYAPYFLLT